MAQAVYKKMLNKMLEKEAILQQKKKPRRGKTKPQNPWSVYIVECHDGTFYTGIAKDLTARIEKHNQGKGAKYTRTRGPVTLRYHEDCQSRPQALKRELILKALPRTKKQALILEHL